MLYWPVISSFTVRVSQGCAAVPLGGPRPHIRGAKDDDRGFERGAVRAPNTDRVIRVGWDLNKMGLKLNTPRKEMFSQGGENRNKVLLVEAGALLQQLSASYICLAFAYSAPTPRPLFYQSLPICMSLYFLTASASCSINSAWWNLDGFLNRVLKMISPTQQHHFILCFWHRFTFDLTKDPSVWMCSTEEWLP